MTTKNKKTNAKPPTPAPPPPIDDLPHPLTIFVSHGDRNRIVAALCRIHGDRATALRIALGLQSGGDA